MRNIEIAEVRNRILLEDPSSRSYLVIWKLKLPCFVEFGLKIVGEIKIGRNDEMIQLTFKNLSKICVR